MREIKFRAWDKNNSRMIDLKKVTPLAMAANLGIDGIFIPFAEQYKLMQYTGLKDKNGVEIYEGDILRFDDTGEEGYEYKEGFDFQNVARVEFQDGRFQLTDFASENSGVLYEMHNFHIDFVANFKYSEVIGNIHDNPELMEGGQANE